MVQGHEFIVSYINKIDLLVNDIECLQLFQSVNQSRF